MTPTTFTFMIIMLLFVIFVLLPFIIGAGLYAGNYPHTEHIPEILLTYYAILFIIAYIISHFF